MRTALVILVVLSARAECIAVNGSRVRGADLGLLPAEADLGAAPVPGVQRHLSGREISRALQQTEVPSDVCVTRAVHPLAVSDLEQAMRTVLNREGLTIEILDWSRISVPEGKPEFRTGALSTPPIPDAPVYWRGRFVYDEGRSLSIWARVRMAVQTDVLVAQVRLLVGKPITGEQVAVKTRPLFPTVSVRLPDYLGKMPRREIRAGQILTAALLDSAKEVFRGDPVKVAVESGSAEITFEAVAESAGRKGDQILIRNPLNGRRFPAVILGKGQVMVRANAHS